MISSARDLIARSLSVIPTDDLKRPMVPSWTKHQQRPMTEEEVVSFFGKEAKGIAIICGKVSNNVEVIDIDLKYDITGILYDRYVELIKESIPGTFEKLLIVRTVSGGYHFYYRCATIGGNKALAKRPATREELAKDPQIKAKVLIETRGEGGYIVAPPTRGYTVVQANEIPVINANQG
jgi:hypothetical protein